MRKGITLLSLVITIVVLLIILSTVIISTVNITNNSKKTTFAKDLKTIGEAVNSVYLSSGVVPTLGTAYTATGVKAMSADATKLQLEFVENSDTTCNFYELDLTKIGIKNTSRGAKKNGNANDIYFISDNLNVYYPLGLKIGTNIYFSITSTLINESKVAKVGDIGTGDAGSTFANGIKLTKDKKTWASEIVISLDIIKNAGDVIKYSIAGQTEKTAATDSIVLNYANLTAAERTAISTGLVANKKVYVRRLNSVGTQITTATIYIKNLDIDVPIAGAAAPSLTTGVNTNTLTFSSMVDTGGSGLKELRYEYITKLNSSNADENAYSPMPTISTAYFKTIAKKSKSINSVELPKHIKTVAVSWIDNAGNVAEITNYTVDAGSLVKEISRLSTSNDYVKEGLLLQLDGIDNGGYGIHNDNASATKNKWKDLSGNSRDGDLPTNTINYTAESGWGTNCLTIDGINDYVNITPFQKTLNIDPSKYTVEFVFNSKDTTLNSNYYGLIGVDGSIGAPNEQTLGLKTVTYAEKPGQFFIQANVGDNGSNYVKVEQEFTIGSKYSIQYYSNSGELGMYKNGANKLVTPYTFTPLMFRDYIYLGWISAARYAKADIYAVRIYNRVLTEEEIKHNYATDVKRFGL